jgi:hypothetical protein
MTPTQQQIEKICNKHFDQHGIQKHQMCLGHLKSALTEATQPLLERVKELETELAEAQQWIDSEPDWKDKYNANFLALQKDRDWFKVEYEALKAIIDQCIIAMGSNKLCLREAILNQHEQLVLLNSQILENKNALTLARNFMADVGKQEGDFTFDAVVHALENKATIIEL